jgi:hypothetical protein
MVDVREVLDVVKKPVGRLLKVAEALMTPEQFRAFRSIALDEFGWRGLGAELQQRSARSRKAP